MKEMRPTTGKVVLALFNILGSLRENSFLDLFSGSGQIAIEAFKKGASPVYSVESERKRAAEIAKKAPDGVKCLCMDARRAVGRFAKNGEKFDIIFADPRRGHVVCRCFLEFFDGFFDSSHAVFDVVVGTAVCQSDVSRISEHFTGNG